MQKLGTDIEAPAKGEPVMSILNRVCPSFSGDSPDRVDK